jgi:4-amino-4-deoxy-L-arabinose transferase-like glycosyltransferase
MCLALALYAKVLLVFLIPLPALSLLIERGPKSPSKRTVLIAVAAMVGLSLPLVVLTANVAKASLIWVFFHPGQHFSLDWLWAYPSEIWQNQLSRPAVVLCCLGLLLSIFRHSRRGLFFLIWIMLVYVELLFIGPSPDLLTYPRNS